jgi:hypothetical protein
MKHETSRVVGGWWRVARPQCHVYHLSCPDVLLMMFIFPDLPFKRTMNGRFLLWRGGGRMVDIHHIPHHRPQATVPQSTKEKEYPELGVGRGGGLFILFGGPWAAQSLFYFYFFISFLVAFSF